MQHVVNEMQYAALSFASESRLAFDLDPAWHIEFDEIFDFENASIPELLDLAARSPTSFFQGWIQAQAFTAHRSCY